MPVELRDYQRDALAAIARGERQGLRRQLVVLPTGCGKTVIMAEAVRQTTGRVLILVHRDELATQTVDKILAADPTADVGIVKAERDEVDRRVIVASVQTLARRRRLERLGTDFALVVIDEAHHANADSYQSVLRYFGAL
jgi:superfamily II DNA or RNA helicase